MHQTAPCSTNLHQVAPIGTKLHQTAPCCTNLHQIEPNCTKLHQTASSCTKLQHVVKKGVCRQHTTFTSNQNAACSNKFFSFSLTVRLRSGGKRFDWSNVIFAAYFKLRGRDTHIDFPRSLFLVGMICPLMQEHFFFDLFWNVKFFIGAK